MQSSPHSRFCMLHIAPPHGPFPLWLACRFSIFTREQEHKQKAVTSGSGESASDLVAYVAFQVGMRESVCLCIACSCVCVCVSGCSCTQASSRQLVENMAYLMSVQAVLAFWKCGSFLGAQAEGCGELSVGCRKKNRVPGARRGGSAAVGRPQ